MVAGGVRGFGEGHMWLQGGMHGYWGVCMVAQEVCLVMGGCVVAGVTYVVVGGMHGCLGACMVAGGVRGCGEGHMWLQGGMCGCPGACVVARGMHGCQGVCMVVGGMHGGGENVVARGGMVVGRCAWLPGGHVCGGEGMRRIRRDTVNERAVCILLECSLVGKIFVHNFYI